MPQWKGLERTIRANEPLAMHTWLGVGGHAEFYAEPRDTNELVAIVQCAYQQGVPVKVLGSGSNVLIRDEGVSGVVIQLTHPHFADIAIDGNIVSAGGGAALSRVITTSVHEGLAGLEVLTAIPGTIGGGLKGNVGAHGGDIGQWVKEVTVLDCTGEISVRDRTELIFGYRRSSLDDLVILQAKFELEPEDSHELARRLQKLWIVRKAAQPMGHQASVRVFRDPRGTTAAEVIEAAGLKGTRIGGAVVSERNANFIVTEPNCTTTDILRLIDTIRGHVLNRLGVSLELDLEIW
ncbi:MAG: UDP-N-acetylmuramate dehydrogenase [Thermogutta sp.]